MSRAAVIDALKGDSVLQNDLGPVDIYANYEIESSNGPNFRDRMFAVLRFGGKEGKVGTHGPTDLDVWVHMPEEMGSDFVTIDNVSNRIIEIITGLEQEDGADGQTLTVAKYMSSGGDFTDPGYKTVTRNSTFQLVFRPTAA